MPNKRLSAKPFKKQTLAEQVTDSIVESILRGDWQGGEALPTEPEIAAQFGVSRAVVRDATRMLAAKGLVKAQHGRGVFVTDSPLDAFGEALLLALRRMDATVWDLSVYEQSVYPEMIALAAQNAESADMAVIRTAVDKYLTTMQNLNKVEDAQQDETVTIKILTSLWADIIQAINDATHNKLFSLLARPVLGLRSWRNWAGMANEDVYAMDAKFLNALLDVIEAGDPEQARQHMRRQFDGASDATISVMQNTPIGEVLDIVPD